MTHDGQGARALRGILNLLILSWEKLPQADFNMHLYLQNQKLSDS